MATRWTSRPLSMVKSSPESSVGDFEAATVLSQYTDVKVRNALFLNGDTSLVLWLGYSDGHCLAVWRRRDDINAAEPFEQTARLQLDADPIDIVNIANGKYAVSLSSGDVIVVKVSADEVTEVHRFKNLHGNSDSRCIAVTDSTLYSGSSGGSIVSVDLSSGATHSTDSGYGGVLCLSPLAGGSLLASGHSVGQLAVWDAREKNTSLGDSPSVVTPAKTPLDAVTALTTHSAQANLIAYGTDNGTIGFCDVRGPGAELLPSSFDVASSTITQVRFHPQCGEHMICSSSDGTLIHWDASGVNALGFRSVSSKQSPWLLGDQLADNVRLNTLKGSSFSAVNGFDVSGNHVVAASDMMSIITFDNIKFPIPSSSSF